MAPEAWWPRAVFYRIDPARFQDADGDGRGDLPGVAQRLDYLQSLGVDALLLDSGGQPLDTEALGDLVREASRRRLRVLVAVDASEFLKPQAELLRDVRSWLGAGAAGVWAPRPASTSGSAGDYAGLVGTLRSMVNSFPGERVLLTDPAPIGPALAAPARPPRSARRIDPGSFGAARGGVLMTTAAIPTAGATLPQLRFSLASAGQDAVPGVSGLLQFAQPPATASPNAAADAALLFGSRGAVILDFGTEIGLDTFPAVEKTAGAADTQALPLMQWTPSNRTAAPADAGAEKAPTSAPAPGSVTEFGAYHPYRPPPRNLIGAVPTAPRIVADPNIPAALPDADTLPGFTAGTLTQEPANGKTLNVITQDRDPRSLLNLYRQLIALHHDNQALHNGAQIVLNHDAEGALVWVRRIPVGARTAANVVAAANLSEQPVTLALDGDLAPLGIRPGVLRPIFSSAATALTGESTGRLQLPAHAVFMGEITGGRLVPVGEPAPRVRRGRRRHRR